MRRRHLGQDDLPSNTDERFWTDKLIGISTHSVEQARKRGCGADYIGFGPCSYDDEGCGNSAGR